MRVFSSKTKTNLTNKRNHTLIDESNCWCWCSAKTGGERLDSLHRVCGGVEGGKRERRRVETLGVVPCQGQPNTLNPWQQLGEVGLSDVISLGLSRDFLCLMYFQVPCDFKLYCLLNELSGFLLIVCLSVCSLTTMCLGETLTMKETWWKKSYHYKTVYSYYYCFDPILMICS